MPTYTFETVAQTTRGCIKIAERRIHQLVAGVPEVVRASHFLWDRSEARFVTLVPIWRDGDGVPWLITVEEFKFGVFAKVVSFPGGGVDLDDSSQEEAAHREILEEVCLKVGSLTLLAENLVEFPDKVAGGEHAIFIGEVLDLRVWGEPEHAFAMHRLQTREDLQAFLARETNRRMLTRLAASEAFLYLTQQP